MNKFTFYFLLLLVSLASCQNEKNNSWEISSPDGKIIAQINIDDSGALSYTVKHGEITAIEPSSMGFEFEEQSFTDGLSFVGKEEKSDLTEAYTLTSGKRIQNSATWNELSLSFKNSGEKPMNINIRAYEEGIAFNYEFPGENEAYTFVGESTSFNLPDAGKAWMQAYDTVMMWTPAYETFYQNAIDIGTPAPWNKNGWSLPMLFNTENGLWTLIADANLNKGFVGMHVESECENGNYTLRLPEHDEAYNLCTNTPTVELPFVSPWRLIITGESLATSFESNLVYHVADKNAVGDVSWVKPGRASWSWWSESDSPKDYKSLVKFVDFAAEMGWEYSLVDANWDEMKGGDLKQLADYAKTKNVGLLVWYNSGGPNNVVTEKPRDIMFDPERRKEEFKKLHEWGIKGVKVDFFQSDKACIIAQYHDILVDAAEYEILVNFHGCTIPRGWRKKYPNLVSMESVRGAECYKFDGRYPGNAPAHNTLLPFTRNVVGPMDYTPVVFSEIVEYLPTTTYAHELALSVLFETGIQHFADHYSAYLALPDFALEFLKNVPVVWDDSKYVDGYPGETAVIARKNGNKWYVAGINGIDEAKNAKLDLSFLPEGKYTMQLIEDGQSNKEFAQKNMEVSNEEMILEIKAKGGFVGVISVE